MPGAHPLQQGGNGLRMIGGYQSGAILGVDNSTGQVKWYKRLVLDLSRQHNPLVTASDLLFHTQMDGYVVGRDAATGDELWRYQMGAPSQAGTISYMVNGEQYIATTNMAGSQPYSQGGNGDAVFAWKVGGKALYTTGPRSAPVVVSGSQEAPDALPIPNIRRPVDNTAAGIVPATEVWMARSNGTATSTGDSILTASMIPSTRTVAVGTTVTFRNPGVETFPTAPNLKEHCATQYFEGKFNFRLQPGQTATYKFDREGEYFYNDCTDPRPTGKVLVTLASQPATLQVVPSVLQLKPTTGVYTSVTGTFTAIMTVPAGWTLGPGPVGLGDPTIGSVQLKAPLTTKVFGPVTTAQSTDGTSLVMTFNKADIDNNVPAGTAVPLVVSANFLDGAGVQRKLEGTAVVRVMK
jgi:plastocyanin